MNRLACRPTDWTPRPLSLSDRAVLRWAAQQWRPPQYQGHYKAPRAAPPTFHQSPPEKVRHNREFASCLPPRRPGRGRLLVLDGVGLGTTRTLLQQTSFTAEDLHVPNHHQQLPLPHHYPCTLYEWLRDVGSTLPRDELDGAALDYCGTLSGNETDCKPWVELSLLLRLGLLRRAGGVLWLTFCKRHPSWQASVATVLELAHAAGYEFQVVREESYVSQLGSRMYRLLLVSWSAPPPSNGAPPSPSP